MHRHTKGAILYYMGPSIKYDTLIHSFIHSGDLYSASKKTTTQRRSQPSHGQKRRTSERFKIWKGVPSARNAAHRGDHSMLKDPQPFGAAQRRRCRLFVGTTAADFRWSRQYV